ncbi:MAG: maleylpyruvate isomerase family mycothiol-dependent enzyme [Actinomycetota bacterium]
MAGMDEPVAELEAEHGDLEAVLRPLSDEQWLLPTPAEGWDIRDQVSHLADTNDICVDTITAGPRPLNTEALRFPSPEAFTQSGVDKGRAMTPAAVLEWWRTSAARNRDALRACDARDRVPWGLGMSAKMMATARMMETWAHGGDIRGALGLEPSATPRLRSVAFLTVRAVPYALSYAKVEQPPGTLRAELTFDGEVWPIGPYDADNLITGDALEFCRLGIRRTTRAQTQTLKAIGPLAEAALDNLRAFL